MLEDQYTKSVFAKGFTPNRSEEDDLNDHL